MKKKEYRKKIKKKERDTYLKIFSKCGNKGIQNKKQFEDMRLLSHINVDFVDFG